MASIRKEILIGADVATAWDAVSDFGAVHQRVVVGFVTAVQLLDGDRVVTFANGSQARERLVARDDDLHRLVYTVVESAVGLTHHQASVEVFDRSDGSAGSRLVWTADLLPDALSPAIENMMDLGAAAIARTLAG